MIIRIIFISILLSIFNINISSAEEYHICQVTYIVDGDTLDVICDNDHIVRRVRVLDLNTYEVRRTNRAKFQANDCEIELDTVINKGKEAKLFLQDLLLNKKIMLNITNYNHHDQYMRLLGSIIFKQSNGELINLNDYYLNNRPDLLVCQ